MADPTVWNPREHSSPFAVLLCALTLLYGSTAQLMAWLPKTLVWHAGAQRPAPSFTCFDCGLEGSDPAVIVSLIGIAIALPAIGLAGWAIIGRASQTPKLRRDITRLLGLTSALFAVAMVFLFDDTTSSLLNF